MNQPPTKRDFDSTRQTMECTRIGEWVLHPDLGVLRDEDAEVRLNAKTLHVLLVLLEAGERGVARTELLDRVWGSTYPNDTVVSRAISDLRAAFGEKAGEEKYLRTLPKFGYQLVAPVSQVTETSTAEVSSPDRKAPWKWIVLPILVAVIALLVRQFQGPEPQAIQDYILPQARPLTSAPGLEHQPRLVPGKDWVVYAALRDGHQDWDLFRVSRSDGSSQGIAVSPGVHEHGPAISPQGDQVAYVRLGSDGCQVVVQSLVLGVPEPIAACTDKFPTLVDWSSSGRLLAFTAAEANDEDGYRRLQTIDIQSGQGRVQTHAVTPTGTDFYPRFSPDDRQLAFLRGEPQPDHRSTLWVTDLRTQEERQLTEQAAQITGMTWLNQQELLYGFIDSGLIEGRILDLQTGVQRTINGFDLIHPEYSSDEALLIGARQRGKRDLYLMNEERSGRIVAESTSDDYHGRLSPDGNWIAYVSRRSGYEEIWIANTSNQSVRRLTNFEGATVRYPDWHPDGTQILFSAQTANGERLFEVEVISGTVSQPFSSIGESTTPRWLPDGKSWVHGCKASTRWAICISDKQETRQIANGFFMPQPLADNVIAAVDSSGALYRLNIDDGGTQLLWRDLHPRAGWAVSGSKLVYATAGPNDEEGQLLQVDLDTGSMQTLFLGTMPLTDVTISIGKDSDTVLFTRHQKPGDDLVVIETPGFEN